MMKHDGESQEELDDFLSRVIFYLLTINRTSDKETEQFIRLKHNAHLCAGLNRRLETVLGFFSRYKKISYDIQGIKDHGTDVILIYYMGNRAYHICFQIKSEKDFENKYLLRDIKAQYADSKNMFNLTQYYLILACDQKKNLDKIRLIKEDMAFNPDVVIVDPSQFLIFWKLVDSQIASYIKLFIGDNDLIVYQAAKSVADLIITQSYLLYYIVVKYVNSEFSPVHIQDILDSDILKEVHAEFKLEQEEMHKDITDSDSEEDHLVYDEDLDESDGEFPLDDEDDDDYCDDFSAYTSMECEGRILEDLVTLSEDDYIDFDHDKKEVTPILSNLKALLALVLEGQIRYEFDNNEVISYVHELITGIPEEE